MRLLEKERRFTSSAASRRSTTGHAYYIEKRAALVKWERHLSAIERGNGTVVNLSATAYLVEIIVGVCRCLTASERQLYTTTQPEPSELYGRPDENACR
jgi:hypothetical protein